MGSFRPSVVDKRFDILFQALDSVFHFRVELLRFVEAPVEVEEALVNLSILDNDSTALLRNGLVFALIGTNPLVLQ